MTIPRGRGKGISQQPSAYTYNESSSGIHDSVERIYIPETPIICRSLLARKPSKDTMYGIVIPIGQNDGCTAGDVR